MVDKGTCPLLFKLDGATYALTPMYTLVEKIYTDFVRFETKL